MSTVRQLCHLDTRWTASGDEHGRFLCTLTNISDRTLDRFILGVTTVTLNLDPTRITNARRVRFDGSCHEFAPVEALQLAPGDSWSFEIGGLFRKPRHFVDGMSAAYLILDDGEVAGVHSSDLMLEDEVPSMPSTDMPLGELTLPVGLLPWPNSCQLSDFTAPPVALYPQTDADTAILAAISEAGQLARRLFPNVPGPFALHAVRGGLPIRFRKAETLRPSGFRLDFTGDSVTLSAGDATAIWHGLLTLAQLHHAAHAQPQRFVFPHHGVIEDHPRFGWRGCHLDVSRQVYSAAQVRRFIDILAWHKMNVLHWHLTDDEGWRVEIKAFPELVAIGSRRGPNARLSAQLGGGAEDVAGHYTQDEVAGIVSHAGRLHLNIMPEIDVPGHCAAMLEAMPQLRDPGEPWGDYFSGQGFPNNALNPAVDAVYPVLDAIFGELVGLFPFAYVHIGGDEVASKAWLASPLATALMRRLHLTETQELQAHFLRHVKQALDRLGKRMAGWNEVSRGGGVDPDGTLLVNWERTATGPELARRGYDVVMSPGEAYYLDMAQSACWLEPGHHWAGTVSPQKTYMFEPATGFPPQLADRLRGIQAGIWGEHLTSRERFNHMVFPRLSAVAEAAWTLGENKNWLRFCAQSKLMPQL